MRVLRIISMFLVLTLIGAMLIGCGKNTTITESVKNSDKERVYYYVGCNHGHPFWLDVHQGFEFAARSYGVRVVKAGPDTPDMKGMAEALEQTITKKPDGIITLGFDASIGPGIKKAMSQGIPVIVIEATLPDLGELAFVGLDNYACGVETAKELVKRVGDSGKVVIMGNWGASNTDQKLEGIKDYLKESTKWEVIAEMDDKAITETAIEAAKTAFNNYKDMTAILGIDSSSGPAIGAAMEELKIAPGSVTVICHDREDTALEYIEKGYIQATIMAKSASMPWMSLAILQGYNNNGGKDIPLSADNAKAGISPIPNTCYTGTMVVDKNNVAEFKRDSMKKLEYKNYK
jgi:ribose transport system substrate-binding protein